MKSLAIIAVLAASLPVAASSLSLDECPKLMADIHHGETDHQDLGNGVVAFQTYGSFPGFSSTGTLHVSGCATGETMLADVYELYLEDAQVHVQGPKFDLRNAVSTRLKELVASEAEYKIADLGAHLGLPADKWRVRIETEENCACRAAYPKLRNGKKRFKMEPWIE